MAARLIGILGGTFDPIHYGHLRPALEVMQEVSLDEIRFIPNRVPPHRGQPLLEEQQRAELVQQAIAGTPGFVFDDRELHREGPSYMVDTLASLKRDYPGDHLCLVMGVDAFNGFQHWHRWEAILEVCHLIVITRPGSEMGEIASQAPIASRLCYQPSGLRQTPAGQILLQSVTQLDISASLIRTCLESGQSIQFLLPEALREKLEKAYAR